MTETTHAEMNLGALAGFFGILLGAAVGYHYVAPYHPLLGVLAAAAAAVAGWFVGHVVGFLVILPFEGLARLYRFITTGRWTDPVMDDRSKHPGVDDPTI